MLTRRYLLASASAAAVCAVSPQADAQSTYARQPVHILVGYPAGGGVDIIARLLQDPMKAALGQPIIVENRTGASAMLATGAVAKAAPDGHTLLACASGEVAINHFLFKEKMAYDPAKELAPIALVGIVPCVVVVASTTPSTLGMICSIALDSASPDSCDSAMTSVKPAALAACSAPRTIPKTIGLVMSATTRASVLVRPVGSARAMGLTRKLSSAAAARILASVFALTRPGLVRARETVEGFTPASSAMS